ncbi:hypothetical protein Lnau_1270 [Legionella nautarum]|uniref:Peptidase C80 domain-containing protein n=1 Tax=Legionella nautarum TaxID=45070 RepID=A0A0W0WVE9_9GAMM|nr:hypothetical protein [Legionella nautarum]KTD36286.1 hypothetical protein Lnau_1270 [Legionella nautarum]
MARKKQINHSRNSTPLSLKNKKWQSQSREEREFIDENLGRMKSRILREIKEKQTQKVRIVCLPKTDEENLNLCQKMSTRFSQKAKGILVGLKRESEGLPPKPLTLSELEQIQDIPFPPNTTLYISGHGNNFTLSELTPEKLVKQVSEFLIDTGIRKISLDACNSGVAYYPEDVAHVTDINLVNALTTCYAKRFSLALHDSGVEGVEVFGYRGSIQDEKIGHKEKKIHRISTFFASHHKSSETKERGSRVRVGYTDGILTTEPELTEDIYIEKLNTEGEAELVRTTYN